MTSPPLRANNTFDGVSARPRDRRARFDAFQFWMRIGVVYLLALGSSVVESAGPERSTVALYLALLVGPAHFAVRTIAKVPNPAGWLDLLAVVAGVGAAIIEPQLWPAALLFQMLTLGGAVAFLRPEWMAVLTLTALIPMTAIGVVRDLELAPQLLFVTAVFVPVFVGGTQRKTARENRASLRIRTTVDSLPLIIWEGNSETGEMRSITGRIDQVLRRSHRHVLQNGIFADIHPDDRDAYLAALKRARMGSTRVQYRYMAPDGSTVWLLDRIVPGGVRSPEVVRGVTVDISTERDNSVFLQRHINIVEQMPAMSIVVEPHDGQLIISHLADPIGWGAPTTGTAPNRLFVDTLPELTGCGALVALIDELTTDEASLPTVHHLDPCTLFDATGAQRTIEIEVFSLPEGATALLVNDVSEREEMLAIVRHQATHDGLTGLANRETLLASATDAIAARKQVTLALIDLNEFKSVNDTLGHLTGDEYLRVIGHRLLEAAKDADLIVRLGGDEFAALLIDKDQTTLEGVLANISTACRTPVVLHGAAISGSASIGVARSPQHAASAESLLRCADLAMYSAKRARVGTRYYDVSLDRTSDQIELLSEVGRAFDNHEFKMSFQPIVAFADGSVTGVEALVRWDHPERGLLPPGTFLDLIDVAGYGAALTDTALEAAAGALTRLPAQMGVSVNMTARDVRSVDLPERCAKIFAAADVALSRLTVEITESEVLDVDNVVDAVLGDLATMGVTIAVDDFGTGFSSLSHLRELPLGEIKIDRAFVMELLDNDQDRAIVRSMVDLGHHLGMKVTAEGIEDEATAASLQLLGCDSAQGFLYGQPSFAIWENILGPSAKEPPVEQGLDLQLTDDH